MNAERLDEILSCPTLPSLPAIALRVIEMTQQSTASMRELADTIQNDQGLAAKVLRTVNSSYYGLRRRCATINQAIVMLGLSTVKSLALGFSLVGSLAQHGRESFDHVAYWRRGLLSGVGARAFAKARGSACQDEVFLGGLLQDIGMLAMLEALKGDYTAILARAPDHRSLVKEELAALELQHADVGAMLAKRWKLPDELVIPIKYHERPTAAPAEHADLARYVALGNLAHDAITEPDPRDALSRLTKRGDQWFGLRPEDIDGLIAGISAAAHEMANLFSLDIGPYASTDEVLAAARQGLIHETRSASDSLPPASPDAAVVLDPAARDAQTGLATDLGIAELARLSFADAAARSLPLSILAAKLIGVGIEPDAAAARELALAVTALLRKHFDPMGATIGRTVDGGFTIVAPGVASTPAVKAAEAFRLELSRASPAWPGPSANASACVGVATYDNDTRATYSRVQQLVGAAARALDGAVQQAGQQGGCVRVFVPRKLAA